jgi:hypothetical protein
MECIVACLEAFLLLQTPAEQGPCDEQVILDFVRMIQAEITFQHDRFRVRDTNCFFGEPPDDVAYARVMAIDEQPIEAFCVSCDVQVGDLDIMKEA